MNELITLISRQAGISETQAAAAVEIMTDYMINTFPEPVARQVGSLLRSKQAYLDCLDARPPRPAEPDRKAGAPCAGPAIDTPERER